MPMPHRTYKQVIKRRIDGKEGSERSASCARSSPSCPTTGTAPTRTSASGSTPRSKSPRPRRGRQPGDVRRAPRGRRADASSARRTRASRRCCRPCRRSRSRLATSLHDHAAHARADTDPRRPRSAGRDPRADHWRRRGSRRRTGAARGSSQRRCDRLLPGRGRPSMSSTCAREVAAAGIEKQAVMRRRNRRGTSVRPPGVRGGSGLGARRGFARAAARGDLAAHGSRPHLPTRRRSGRAPPAGDSRRRGAADPQGAGGRRNRRVMAGSSWRMAR